VLFEVQRKEREREREREREITRDKIRTIPLNAKRLDDFLCWSTFRLGTRKLQKNSRLKGFAIEISIMR
jgi:hypothetical protein